MTDDKHDQTIRGMASSLGVNIDRIGEMTKRRQDRTYELAHWFASQVFPVYLESMRTRLPPEEMLEGIANAQELVTALRMTNDMVAVLSEQIQHLVAKEDADAAKEGGDG